MPGTHIRERLDLKLEPLDKEELKGCLLDHMISHGYKAADVAPNADLVL